MAAIQDALKGAELAAYESGFLAGVQALADLEYKAVTCLVMARKFLEVEDRQAVVMHPLARYFIKGWKDAC